MPTFIDESGDTGWLPGALPFFRMAAVWLPTFDAVEACRASIRKIRAALGMKKHDEFKFSKTTRYPERRRAFFDAVLEHDFRFVGCGYDKSRLAKGSLEPRGFHWGCAVVLATHLRATYVEAEREKSAIAAKPVCLNELVVVDNNQDREFLAEIRRAFAALRSERKPGAKLVKKVKFRGSKPDEMLQFADMVVGAVGARFDGDEAWYDIIAPRNVGAIGLPENSEGRVIFTRPS